MLSLNMRASKLAQFLQLPWQKYYLWEPMKHLLHVTPTVPTVTFLQCGCTEIKDTLISLVCYIIIINQTILCYVKYDRVW